MKMSIKWIKINLPWYLQTKEPFDSGPDLSEKERKVFGYSLDELDDSFNFTEYYNFLIKIAGKPKAKYKNHKILLGEKKYQRQRRKILDWQAEQPETLAFQKQQKAQLAEESRKSFCGRGLAVPGTLIELETGEVHLIGTINQVGGLWDDCLISPKTIVKRYSVVFKYRKLNK